MKIKNKYSKQKIDKKNIRLNNRLNFIKKIRLLTRKIKPLTKMEEFLFIEKHPHFDRLETKEKDKYIYISDIIIENIVLKNNCNELFNGILNLYKTNPLNGYLGGEIHPDQLKSAILSFSKSYNQHRWTRLCSISPNDKELYKYCDYIEISIFEISNDLIGISFNLSMTSEFKKQSEKILTKKVKAKTIYTEYKYKNKKSYGVSCPALNSYRNSDYEDFILEIKDRFNKLFNKFLPLELDYKVKSPISLNIYQTNYDIKNDESSYLKSLDFIEDFHFLENEKGKVCVRGKTKGDDIIDTDIWYSISIGDNEIDRSNNIYYFVENKEWKIISSSSKYVNILSLTIAFYQLEEMINYISRERHKLYDCSYKKIRKNFKQYEFLNKNINIYKMIFDNFKYWGYSLEDNYLKKGYDNLNKKYKEYYQQYEVISNEYNFRLNINNLKSAYFLTVISVIIALIALFLTIYFENRQVSSENNNSNYGFCKQNIIKEEKPND